MATWLEELLVATEKLEDASIKDAIRAIAKKGSQEGGKALSDLNTLKATVDESSKEMSKLKESKANYEEIAGILAKNGMDAKNAESVLKQLNVEKTQEDETKLLKKMVEDLTKENKGFKDNEVFGKRKSFLDTKIADAIKEYKDKDGNEYTLVDKFIDKDALYKPIDVESEALVNDRVTQALQNAHQSQEQFKQDTGMEIVNPVHKAADSNSGHFQQNGITNETKIFDKYKESGRTITDAAQTIMQIEANKTKE